MLADAATPGAVVVATTSWAELIQHVAAGRPGSFDQLHTQTSKFVLRITEAVIRDHSQAEEITQEVFLEVWRTAARFDPAKGSAESWLRRLAHSRAVDRVRHAQASRMQEHLYVHLHALVDVDDVVPMVLARVAAAEVQAAFDQLSLFQRQALLLTHIAGLTNVRASELLGVPLPTLKSRIRQGLQMLRREMAVPGPDGEDDRRRPVRGREAAESVDQINRHDVQAGSDQIRRSAVTT